MGVMYLLGDRPGSPVWPCDGVSLHEHLMYLLLSRLHTFLGGGLDRCGMNPMRDLGPRAVTAVAGYASSSMDSSVATIARGSSSKIKRSR